MGLKKKLKKLSIKNIGKGIKKTGKELEKGVKKAGKELEKTAKKVAIPVAITLVSGGTLTAAAVTAGKVLVADEATRKIKNPVLKAATGAAITGGLSGSGSSTIAKDVVKTATITHVAKQTKSAAAGAVVGAAVCGEYKNVTDVVKSATKEVARENVTKVVAKKTKNQILAQGAGHLVGVGIDNIYESLEKKDQVPFIEDDNQKEESITETLLDESDDALCTPFPEKLDDSPYTPFPEERSLDTILDNAGDRLLSNIDNGYNSSGIKSKVNLMSSLDSKEPNIRLMTSISNGNNITTISQDLGYTKISSVYKLTDNYSIGSASRISNDLDDVRYGSVFKSDNQTREAGVGFDRKGIWDSEAYAYTSLKTDVKTDVVGACVLKETLRQDLEVPLCGKVGTLSQQTLVCSDSITVTDKLGLNANAGLCGVSMIPAARGASLAAKGGSALLKNSGKLAGILTVEELAPAGYAFAAP